MSNVVNEPVGITAGWPRFAVRADTIAAIFTVLDTVYLFTLAGTPIEQRPIGIEGWRNVPTEAPPARTFPDPALLAYLTSFDYLGRIFWLPNGDLALAWFAILPTPRMNERVWQFAVMNRRGGTRALGRIGEPLLLQHDTLWTVGPDELPNQWIAGRVHASRN